MPAIKNPGPGAIRAGTILYDERKYKMNNYKYFAKTLLDLLGDVTAVRITSKGYMPLSIEDIGLSAKGHRLISMCHYGEQNGDLMRDPDMVFALITHDDLTIAEPISYRNDYMGIDQEVYRYDEAGKRTHVDPKLKRELKSFALTWIRNIKAQGFLTQEAKREPLS